MEKFNTSILIFGEPRTYIECYKSIFNNINDQNKNHNIDIYLIMWKKDYDENINKYYNPKGVILLEYSDFLKDLNNINKIKIGLYYQNPSGCCGYKDKNTYFVQLWQWYKGYEFIKNKNYDYIIKTRFDNMINKPIIINQNNIFLEKRRGFNNKLYKNEYNMFDDLFFILKKGQYHIFEIWNNQDKLEFINETLIMNYTNKLNDNKYLVDLETILTIFIKEYKKYNYESIDNNAIILITPGHNFKQIYVVGNGSSLKDFDFNFLKDKEWIGCTLGFRHWEELGFYPTHYVNVDLVVCEYQLEKIKDMIINNKCKTFLLTSHIIQFWNEILNYKNVYYIEQLKSFKNCPFQLLYDWCSGSSAACYGICMGANTINLLGMDCNYIEFIHECEKQSNGTLKIIKQPINNPNYYYPTYQRVGDLYNVPNTDRIHKKSWNDLNNLSKRINNNIIIKNYNTSDKLDNIFNRYVLNDIKSL